MKALITGASSGIGRDIAINLSKKGYDLILVARDLEKLNEVKSKLHTNVEVVSMDVSNAENCKELHEKYQNIDILVNNAGFGDCGYFTKTSLDKELKKALLKEKRRQRLRKISEKLSRIYIHYFGILSQNP